MTSLRERAAEMAGSADTLPVVTGIPDAPSPYVPDYPAMPDADLPEPDPNGPELVSVYVAWSRVMGDVRSIGKTDKVTEGPAKFAYRGVDTALNKFGPVCRRHGVLVLPVKVEPSYRDTKTSTGKSTRECTVVVTYRIVGPRGDFLEVQAAGESLDTGDKGSAKAQAVALRTLLYHAGLVPTGDLDPDAQTIERGEADVRMPQDYRDEAVDPDTTRARLAQINFEVKRHGLIEAVIVNENGDEETLGALILRVGNKRFGARQ